MERRMIAEAEKEMPGVRVAGFATYDVRMVARDGCLAYEDAPLGMWAPERYLSLPKGDWSLRHYEALLTDPGWRIACVARLNSDWP